MTLTDSQKTATKVWTGLTALVWVGYLGARVTVGGMCERPTLVENFDRTQYLGRWYENVRAYDVPFEKEDCATATYVAIDNNYIEVNNIEYSIADAEFKGGNPTPPGRA